MSLHLQRQIDQLKKRVLSLGTQVEENLERATHAIRHHDSAIAQQVIEQDQYIDLAEVDIEEECLHTLALYQPVAMDLRYVIAVLKINNDLERIGDLSVNIALQAADLAHFAPTSPIPFDLPGMTKLVRQMVQQSLDALVNIDAQLAESICKNDDAVDRIHQDMYKRVEQAIRQDPELVRMYIHLLSVSRYLERIADHAVNIAEDVIYMAKGDITRHNQTHPAFRNGEEDNRLGLGI